MNVKRTFIGLSLAGLTFSSCVSNKKYAALQEEMQSKLALANKEVEKCGVSLSESLRKISGLEQEILRLKGEINSAEKSSGIRSEQLDDLKAQLADCRAQRDKQASQVGNLTVLTQSANDNIKETLSQLERKDKYIQLLQAAKTKADSINLALAVNLKGVLQEGLDDKDVEVKVDKTVVFVNLSDKMLFQSGSATITTKANNVLGKIAKIVESRPEVEVMVEGYTDNVPIKNNCMEDNWDLSVKRSSAVVRALQKSFKVDPNRLIAAGRSEYNPLASNTTPEGRSTNRRTRIIILPKLDQFYDLLNPNNAPK
ncbi:MAG: OmpA family protein [Saprospiraceae bacterium]|nr:OmpA family protein [Saprospiraceae bacterium]